MARKKSPGPTDRELAILGVLWTKGPSTVREVHEALDQDAQTGYTTTLKLMQIMVEKGLLVREDGGSPEFPESRATGHGRMPRPPTAAATSTGPLYPKNARRRTSSATCSIGFSPGTIERLGWILVHFLWQAAAVALLLAVLLRLLRRAGVNVRYATACGALALMPILPLVTMRFVEVTGPVAEAGPLPDTLQTEAVEPTPAILHTVPDLPPLGMTPPLETASLAVPVPLRERIVAAVEPGLPYVVFGWLAGVFGLSAWHLGGWTARTPVRDRSKKKRISTPRSSHWTHRGA